MIIIDGIAYASIETDCIEVVDVRALDDMILIVTFNNNEQRIFDATPLLDLPAFKRIAGEKVFKNPKIINGIVTWCDGEIDIAPETMYKESFKYEHITQSS